jgi:hypothetical protein
MYPVDIQQWENATVTPEMKKKSIDALRSGVFIQHIGTLHNEDRTQFCCIGVMGQVNGCLTGRNTRATAAALDLHEILTLDASEFLYEKLGKRYAGSELGVVLVSLNDEYRWNFDRIADFLQVAI